MPSQPASLDAVAVRCDRRRPHLSHVRVPTPSHSTTVTSAGCVWPSHVTAFKCADYSPSPLYNMTDETSFTNEEIEHYTARFKIVMDFGCRGPASSAARAVGLHTWRSPGVLTT
jgi:hypothetical protein